MGRMCADQKTKGESQTSSPVFLYYSLFCLYPRTSAQSAFLRVLFRSVIEDKFVHWRPLHLHPYYCEQYGWRPEDFPVATALWQRSISLPFFSGMTAEQTEYVIDTIKAICLRYAR